MNHRALAIAVLAAPFLFATIPASAQNSPTPSCSDAYIFDVEELDVLCGPYVRATVQSPAEIDQSLSLASETIQESAPDAIEGAAIRVEITQTVTVAVAGQSEDLDITGSASTVGDTAEANATPQTEPEAPAQNEVRDIRPYSYILP
jgi:hypothetical protein